MVTTRSVDLSTIVQASVDGDEDAWEQLVRRFAGLVAMIIRQYGLSGTDADDVGQLVWLRVVEHLSRLREPAALPGWLVTTTRRECQRYVRANRRSVATDPLTLSQIGDDGGDLDDELLAAERHQALRDGLDELAPQHRDLLILLATDPPLGYAEISQILGMPIGSIGPSRGRALDKLRETTAVRTYLRGTSETAPTGGDRHGLAELG